ncbi:hypothetical protein [Streptomyces sp. ML-6]|nr:hypothetical protein [Streptomyces sp. ML-6]MDK0523940.1 hypothetical protein [Streptomyces sp. ML-6]
MSRWGEGVDFATDSAWLAAAISGLGYACEILMTPSVSAIRVHARR